MEPRKLTKEDIDKVRDIEGFPIGTDEDIIALSDAPYYTACPNPFIEEFIKENGTPYDEATDDYHREPFAADVSEGKNDPLYAVHTYHTKVPYKAIINYILHYSDPGDIVFDGFAGTGMTGVAAKACGHLSLADQQLFSKQQKDAKFGTRKAILVDLAPVATHIGNRYNAGINQELLVTEGEMLASQLLSECGWMYRTRHNNQLTLDIGEQYASIDYTVWSDVMICPHCGREFVFWDVAVFRDKKKMLDKFHCPGCQAELSKKNCILAEELISDGTKNRTIRITKQVPVLIRYSTADGKHWEKAPDSDDIKVIDKIKLLDIPYWSPTNEVKKGDETQEALNKGITTVDLFFQKRNLYALALIWSKASNQMKFIITAFILRSTKMNKVHMHNFLFGGGGWNAGYLTGVIYFPSLSVETSVIELLKERVKNVSKAFTDIPFERTSVISTQSASDLRNIPSNSVDYTFIDPPFGDNLMYSELNFVWESWLKVSTDNRSEAIINRTQGKQLIFYQEAMTKCFTEFYRILKPNRWMTVEFHNSKNAVWNSIQASLNHAGFVIADVRTLNKNQGSFNQVKGASQAIKQDLIISAYKPKDSFHKDFLENAGSEETAWSFVRQHLSNIPVVVISNDKIEIVSERQAYLLFDRMVAYHIMQGIPVPLDATDFYKGLDERFLKRDNMYFLPDQVNEYDTARIKTEVEQIQFSLFVTNEKTAISWLYQQLDEQGDGPQTYAEIQPKFMQEVKSVDRYEAMPELAVLLEENFLQDDKGRWYIPDVTKEGDVAKLREKKLWKEFEGYLNSKGKLKSFRSEAIRVGFSRLWKDKNYQAIVDIAERLPESTIQEDPNLLMYYDISLGRV